MLVLPEGESCGKKIFYSFDTWMILTKMFNGVSLGTTAFDPFGKSELTIL
jgi:hypothetical protein